MRCGYGHVTSLSSYLFYNISGMAKATDFKFCPLFLQATV